MGKVELSILKARQINFSYPMRNAQSLSVFHNETIDVREGEILCLLGPSGCGKSTLLKLLAGFIEPDGGEITYRDSAVRAPFKKGQMVFQDMNQLFPWLTVRDNILFPDKRSLFHRTKQDDPEDKLLRDILRITGLNGFSDYYPSQLSGGMKQRCAIGRALYAQSDILFMDEPFGSLDAPSRSSLQQLVLKLWKEKGTTILFVTHDIAEALILADRLLVFKNLNEPLDFYENPLPRPRIRQDEPFLREENRLYSYLESSDLTL